MDRLLIKGVSLHYEMHGSPEASDTVFMFNGVMASAGSWMAFVKPLGDLGLRVVLHDFMGQLKSDKPEGPYTFEQHIDHILGLAGHLGLDRFHVVGTSYGAEVGMALAIKHPQVVRSLTVIDGVSEIDDVMKHFVQSWKTMCDYEDPYDFFWGMAPTIYGTDFMSAQRDFLEKRAVAMRMVDRSYFEGQKILYDTFVSEVNFTSSLHKIKCPTLIVVGENDILKPVRFSRKIADAISDSEFYIPANCGHDALLEKPKELITLMTGFLRKHTGK